ncbi:hypothetical protein GW17_00054670 [Ensete ventricosum]|nr:hypothetical protein GW17_00054670 [Ensete ventricosum]
MVATFGVPTADLTCLMHALVDVPLTGVAAPKRVLDHRRGRSRAVMAVEVREDVVQATVLAAVDRLRPRRSRLPATFGLLIRADCRRPPRTWTRPTTS